MPDARAALDVLGEPGWGLLLAAAHAFDASGGDALAAAEKLRRARPGDAPERRAAALELTAEGAKLAVKLGLPDARLIAVRGAVEQATAGRVATWHAQRIDGEARVVEIGCGVGGDSIALGHRVRNLLAVDTDAVRAACAHVNLATFGLSSARAVAGDGLEVLDGEGAGADVVFCDPDRRPEGRRTLDPEQWRPPLSRLRALAAAGRRVLVKAAPSLDAADAGAEFRVTYVSHGGECVEAFLESKSSSDPDDVRAVLLPDDGPSIELSGDRSPARTELTNYLESAGRSLYTVDPAAIRAHFLAELANRHDLALLDPQIAYLAGASGEASPWLREHRVLGSCDIQDVPAELRRLDASGLRVHTRGVAATAEDLDRSWRGAASGAGPVIDVFVTRLQGRPAAVLASRVQP